MDGRPGDGVHPPAPTRLTPRTRAALAVAVTLVALAPILAVVVQRWGHPYLPVEDQATIDLRVHDVWSFSGNTPLVGPFSRFGWSHPGPLFFYLLAVVSAVLGRASWATLVGAALLQGVAVAWLARLAYVTGGLRRQAAWLTVVTLTYVGVGSVALLLVWNPYVALPFFVLFLLQCWVVSTGEPRRLLGLAFVATFLVQTHVGYLFPVALIGAWALVRMWLSCRRMGRPLWRPVIWAPPIILAAVLWFPPLVLDPLLHPPGNVRALVHYFTRGTDGSSRTGLRAGLGYTAAQFHWLPTWAGGTDPVDPFSGLSTRYAAWWLVLPVSLTGVSWWVARRRDRIDDALLAELLLLLVPITVLAIALVSGTPYLYLFIWCITVGVATVVLPCVLLASPPSPGRVLGTGVTALLVVVVAVGSLASTVRVIDHSGPVSPATGMVASLIGQLHHAGQPSGPVQVRTADSGIIGAESGILDHFSRAGAPVYVDPTAGYKLGYARVRSLDQVDSVWFVVEESQVFSLLSADPGAQVLAVSHPLPAPQQAELISLQRSLAATLTAEGRPDLIPQLRNPFADYVLGPELHLPPEQLRQLTALNVEVNAHQCLCGVIAFAPDRVPAELPPNG